MIVLEFDKLEIGDVDEEDSKEFEDIESLMEYVDEFDGLLFSVIMPRFMVKLENWKDFKSLKKHDRCSGLKYEFPTPEMQEMYADYVELEKEKNRVQEECDVLREDLTVARKIYQEELKKLLKEHYKREEKKRVQARNDVNPDPGPKPRLISSFNVYAMEKKNPKDRLDMCEMAKMYNSMSYDESMIYKMKAKILMKIVNSNK